MSDLIRKVERIPKKSCIIQEIIRKMGEGRKWKNVNNEEGNRAELQKTKERIEKCDRKNQNEIFWQHLLRDQELHRTRCYELMYMKTKKLG